MSTSVLYSYQNVNRLWLLLSHSNDNFKTSKGQKTTKNASIWRTFSKNFWKGFHLLFYISMLISLRKYVWFWYNYLYLDILATEMTILWKTSNNLKPLWYYLTDSYYCAAIFWHMRTHYNFNAIYFWKMSTKYCSVIWVLDTAGKESYGLLAKYTPPHPCFPRTHITKLNCFESFLIAPFQIVSIFFYISFKI